MYVVIGKARLEGSPEAAAQRSRDHILPLVQGRAGFRGFCAFVAEQEPTACWIGIFDSRDTALDVEQRIEQWISTGMRDLMPEKPRVVLGETVFDAVAQPQEQWKERQTPLFVVIRSYHGLPGQTETMHSVVSRHTLPAIQHAEGFRGFYAMRDEATPDRAISVTLFDSRENALRSHEEVLGLMRRHLGDMAYQPPEVTMGESVLLATD